MMNQNGFSISAFLGCVQQQNAQECIRILKESLIKISQGSLHFSNNVSSHLQEVWLIWEKFLQSWQEYLQCLQSANINTTNTKSMDLLLECALALNYAFDHFWMLPLLKWFYERWIPLALHGEITSTNSTMAFNPTPQSLALDQQKKKRLSTHATKQCCIALDALRNKLQDRHAYPQTKKMGILFTMNLTFRCYFHLGLLAQLQKVLDHVFHYVLTEPEQQLKQYFSKAERVRFQFYLGKFHLLHHNVPEALPKLEAAYQECDARSIKNQRLIFIYLLSAKLVSGLFPQRQPTSQTMTMSFGNVPPPTSRYSYPDLDRYQLTPIFEPLIASVALGNVQALAQHLNGPCKPWFMRYQLYTLFSERLLLPTYRCLAHRLFRIASSVSGCGTRGYVPVAGSELTRVPSDFNLSQLGSAANSEETKEAPRIAFEDLLVALRHSGDPTFQSLCSTGNSNLHQGQNEEAETALICWLAILIDSGLLRGYVAPGNRCVVVSRKRPFPDLHEAMTRLMEKEEWWVSRIQRMAVTGAQEEEDDD